MMKTPRDNHDLPRNLSTGITVRRLVPLYLGIRELGTAQSVGAPERSIVDGRSDDAGRLPGTQAPNPVSAIRAYCGSKDEECSGVPVLWYTPVERTDGTRCSGKENRNDSGRV